MILYEIRDANGVLVTYREFMSVAAMIAVGVPGATIKPVRF